MNTTLTGGKEYASIQLADGTNQGIYKVHGLENARWLPHDGIKPTPGKSAPAGPDTEAYKESRVPGYGTPEIQEACGKLDGLKTEPRPGTAVAINATLGEHGKTANEMIRQWDRTLQMMGKPPIQSQLDAAKPGPGWFIGKMLEIGKQRMRKNTLPLIGPAVAACAMLIMTVTPVKAEDTLHKEVKAAYAKLQQLTGEEIKTMIVSVPLEQRVQIMELMPEDTFPKYMPKKLLAKGVDKAPPEKIKKGFSGMTEADLQAAAQKAGEKNMRMLLDLISPAKEVAMLR